MTEGYEQKGKKVYFVGGLGLVFFSEFELSTFR